MDFSHGHRTFLTAIANRRVMVGLFCSCVKLTDPAAIPINELCFYASVMVRCSSSMGLSTRRALQVSCLKSCCALSLGAFPPSCEVCLLIIP